MAEVKNAFIKSKMNKDLDSRLLPSGEYRNAINAQVSRSEGADVGALENVLGNTELIEFVSAVAAAVSIGEIVDEASGLLYVFLTDNIGSSYVPTGAGSNHYIYRYNVSSGITTKLVEGPFLNFSTQNPIHGVNLLEDILFFTDNRNQPRKINVTSAETTGYYSTEDNISVARYNPYETIKLFKESALSPTNYETTMKDVSSKFLPDGGSCTVTNTATGLDFVVGDLDIPFLPNEPYVGQKVVYIDSAGVVQEIGSGALVTGWNSGTSTLSISISATLDAGIEILLNANPYYIPNYAGDPKFLEDKFIRFSYRFKFDDGEYSIMAPFTQVCFIPKQDGYFLNNSATEGDQQQAFSSTIVDFMENKVNKIDLQIPLPTIANNLSSGFHIQEIDILYKESDGLTVKVIETIPVNSSFTGASNIFQYEYQAQIPYKTLPTNEIIRVYDKVPVKALGQEIISNRVVYANFQDKHTPPSFLNYNVSAGSKSVFNLKTGTANGTIGVDSTTITLSSILGTINAGSSVSGTGVPTGTTVSSYDGLSIVVSQAVTISAGTALVFNPSSDDSNSTSIIEYPSSNLKTNRNYQVGFVLSDKFGRQSTVILSSDREGGASDFRGSTIYSPYENSSVNPLEWLGNSLKVSVNDPIGPAAKNPNGNGEPGVYNGDVTSEDYNPLGWYSYKIVVKQNEQEYYNVYSAGAMKGLPFNYNSNDLLPVQSNNTSFITLINDNINKVPRDLSEVGPQDKSFRSSVTLFGRVENLNNNINTGNKQYYPGRRPFTTSSIEDLYDLFDIDDFKGPLGVVLPVTNTLNAFHGFFKSDSNPFVAEIVTSQASNNQFGVNNSVTTEVGAATATSVVSNTTEVPYDTLTGKVDIGSIITSINGTAVDSSALDFVVLNITGSATGTMTLNRAITLSNNDVLDFSLKTYNDIESLAIFETAPTISRLDIFWETSSNGLVTDLNNLVLNESAAGATFSSWNDAAFDEAIVLGANILSSNFQIQDNFGSNITLAAGDTFAITSILDQRTPTPVDTSTWFELYEAGGAGSSVYNIKTTAAFVSNVYYNATTGSNDFNFSFQSFINGVYTNINQVANLSNVAPTMKGPDSSGTTPDPAVDFTLTGNTVTTDLFTMTAVNGANSSGSLTGEDITWTVTAVDANGNSVNYFGVSFSNTTTLSTCIVQNTNVNSVTAQTYTLTLRCVDAGNAFQEVVITANLGVIPDGVTDNVFNFANNYSNNNTVRYVVITVNLADDPLNWNGTYIINGSWASLSTGVDNITMKLNAVCSDNPYIFSATSTGAISAYRACYAANYDFPFNTTSTNVTNFLDWSYEVI